MSETGEDNLHDFPEGEIKTTGTEDQIHAYWTSACIAHRRAAERSSAVEATEDIIPIPCKGEYESYVSTRIGGRRENQDTAAFRQTEAGLLLIVCDGMGGGPAGKRASLLAAHVISEYIADNSSEKNLPKLLSDALRLSHEVVKLDALTYPQNFGMGTTAAVLLMGEEQATIAHIGDSRVYQVRDGRMIFRTKDHSLVARKMEIEGWTDEEARTSSESNIITQAIGHSDIEPEIDVRSYIKGDLFLICTDGIWGHYPQKELVRLLKRAPNAGAAIADLMVTTDSIGIDEGNQHDNMTAVILETKCNSKLEDKMAKRSKIITTILGALLAISIILNIVLLFGHRGEKDFEGEERVATENVPKEENKEQNNSAGAAQQAQTNTREGEEVEVTNKATAEEKADTIYIIKSGDAISKIAVRFHVSVEEIKQANPDLDLNRIKPGQSLTIPIK